MKSVDWKAEIARTWHWKQIAAAHDKAGALPCKLPRVGARPEEIASAEHAVGRVFPAEFKEFISLANGWQGFYVLTDLFGTPDFMNGRSQKALERPEVSEFVLENGWKLEEVVAIGASDLDVDVFLLITEEAGNLPGGVVWLAGEEVDRYPTFHEFFGSMVNYNARIANKLAAGQP